MDPGLDPAGVGWRPTAEEFAGLGLINSIPSHNVEGVFILLMLGRLRGGLVVSMQIRTGADDSSFPRAGSLTPCSASAIDNLGLHRITQRADRLDRDVDPIARLQPTGRVCSHADSLRGTGQDHHSW